MPLPRFKFSIRRMMVVVAIAAIALALITMRRRSSDFTIAAEIHRIQAEAHQILAEAHRWENFGIEEEIPPMDEEQERFWFSDDLGKPPSRRFTLPGSPDKNRGPEEADPKIAAWRDSQRRRITHHEEMVRKYDRAARYPWLPVAPDPAEPK